MTTYFLTTPRMFVWVYFVLSILGVSPAFAADPVEAPTKQERTWEDKFINSTYEEEFTSRPGNMVVNKDPFTWALSKEFAERFGMPKQWIDPDLKGALAVAWRTTTIGPTQCGHGGNPNACWPAFTCQMDIYLDSKAPIPWRFNDVERDFLWDGLSSLDYVPRRPPTPRRARYTWINGAFGSKGRPFYHTGWRFKNEIRSAGFDLVYFDRAYAPGVVLLGFRRACPDYGQAAALRFVTEEEHERTRGVYKNYIHTVEFSEAFMQKILAIYKPAWEESKKSNSAYQQTMKRFAPNEQ